MTDLLIWGNAHRVILEGVFALVLWIAAYFWYLKSDLYWMYRRRQPHVWRVDMATKSVKAGPRSVR